ncbi:replication-associated recombination protein A [Acetomicrobium hydrogeniformans]|uniref:Putative replication-associated recombination protein A n=1 Tax=Acetomicrobium hydrogeniformans ATCC BAA-1850 TaxID=592015 RepID=A0A0T5X8U5_9BACT|nr:replication-associated recombination protein A [Acetomicrobium hydrogeniformans]KRT34845.1 putative replication-associated recombination protein A [Acetomicrobium hydrogeniformans ATCC BAA-1850]
MSQMQKDLFENYADNIIEESKGSREQGLEIPLAERMRPAKLEDFVGQEHLLGKDKPLRRLLEAGQVPSCILYGPPGSGKTTLVRAMASVTGRKLFEINAVTAKVAQLRDVVDTARNLKRSTGKSAIVFIDEIYHFNKQQQNALLPSVERGDLILVGTTTENPYFEINKTLLSRAIVFELKPLAPGDIEHILFRALRDKEKGLGMFDVVVDEQAVTFISRAAGGDARQALLRLESVVLASVASGKKRVTLEDVVQLAPKSLQIYDKSSDKHYDIISAFIKSMRGSDPDAAVYWLARMVAGGEDIRFIARRMLIFAAEDVGLANPFALVLAEAAASAVDHVGLPEARIILSECAIYLACAEKSNSSYKAIDSALNAIEKGEIQEVPLHLKSHGEGYVYPHDDPRHWVPQKYMTVPKRFYFPGNVGHEWNISKRLQKLWKRYSNKNDNDRN